LVFRWEYYYVSREVSIALPAYLVVESTRHGLFLFLAYYVDEYLPVDRMKLTEANHEQLFQTLTTSSSMRDMGISR